MRTGTATEAPGRGQQLGPMEAKEVWERDPKGGAERMRTPLRTQVELTEPLSCGLEIFLSIWGAEQGPG